MSTRSLVVVFEYKHIYNLLPPPSFSPRTYFHSPHINTYTYTPYPTLCIVINRKGNYIITKTKRKRKRKSASTGRSGSGQRSEGGGVRRGGPQKETERRERTAPCLCYPACTRGRRSWSVLFASFFPVSAAKN